MVSCSKFWGNLEGIRGNPGEIPQFGLKIPGVYRVKNGSFTFLPLVPLWIHDPAALQYEQDVKFSLNNYIRKLIPLEKKSPPRCLCKRF